MHTAAPSPSAWKLMVTARKLVVTNDGFHGGDGPRPEQAARRDRLINIRLDERTVLRRSPEVEQERAVAIYDLLEENIFTPADCDPGPYILHLRIEDSRLIFDIRCENEVELVVVPLPLTPFRRLIRDYFQICESYYDAIKRLSPSQIEAIDMGRRGLHNEGSQMLVDRLDGRIEMDFPTARRLFTLICVLHIRG